MSHETEKENIRKFELKKALTEIDDIIFQGKKKNELTVEEMEAALRQIKRIIEANQYISPKSICDDNYDVDVYELVPIHD